MTSAESPERVTSAMVAFNVGYDGQASVCSVPMRTGSTVRTVNPGRSSMRPVPLRTVRDGSAETTCPAKASPVVRSPARV